MACGDYCYYCWPKLTCFLMYCASLLLLLYMSNFLTKASDSSNTYGTVNTLLDFSYFLKSNMVNFTESGRYKLSAVHWRGSKPSSTHYIMISYHGSKKRCKVFHNTKILKLRNYSTWKALLLNLHQFLHVQSQLFKWIWIQMIIPTKAQISDKDYIYIMVVTLFIQPGISDT